MSSISTDIGLPVLILPSVIAIYNLPSRRSNHEFIGLSNLYFQARYKGEVLKIPLSEIAKVILEKRKKLAPLIVGGIITSLGLLSILLYSSRLEIVGLVAAGLLLTYYGMQEYLVLHIEHASNTQLIWLPLKVSISSLRPLIAMLEYYVSKSHFPLLATKVSNDSPRLIHYESEPVQSATPILFTFAQNLNFGNQTLVINPEFIDAPIEICSEGKIIGKSLFLINKEAVVDANSTNLT